MTTIDARAVSAAIDEISSLLRAEGADLSVLALDEVVGRVELAVAFDDVECEECVLPPDRLHDTIAGALARGVRRPVSVVLHDPRAERPVGESTADGDRTLAGEIVVLDPTGMMPDDGPGDPGPDAGALRGKTVAVRMDVLWRSWDWTVEEWSAELETAGARVVSWRRVQGQIGEEYARAQAEYEAMVRSADVAISGLANCGSCTSWSVRDALTAARTGIPTTAVATRQFEPLARLLARDGGYAGLRVTVLPFPYDTLPEAEVRRAARAAFPALLDTLGATV